MTVAYLSILRYSKSCLLSRSRGKLCPFRAAPSFLLNGTTDFPGTTIGGFCLNLSSLLDRDVVDKTEISGFFDIHVSAERVTIPMDDAATKLPYDGNAPRRQQYDDLATFRAFQAALLKIGLKLQPAKDPGVFLVHRPHRVAFPKLADSGIRLTLCLAGRPTPKTTQTLGCVAGRPWLDVG